MISYGWAAFGGLILWGIGVSMGIKHQMREQNKHGLLGSVAAWSRVVQQARAKEREVAAGKVHEEADIPTEGPPKH